MSLEEALNKNTAVVEANNALLEKLIARAVDAGAVSGASASDDKPKRTSSRSTKKTDSDNSDAGDSNDGDTKSATVSADDVKTAVAAWLGEFKGDENDPETDARKAKIKEALAKLTKKDGAKITDVPADDLPRVMTWLDKQKAADNGHGVGRLTAKPDESDASENADDDI